MAAIGINGLTLAYDDHGTGHDVIVLVHGHPFNRTMWEPQRDVLVNAGWRVIAPDLRGYGESSVRTGVTTLNEFANDIALLLDTLGVGRVVVGGLSMGGQIAMEFCRAYPDRVCGLLLAATFPQDESAQGKQARYAMAERLLHEGMTPYAEEVLARMMAPASIVRLPATADRVLEMMRNTSAEGAAAALRGRAERPSYVTTLAQMSAPALIVVGCEDEFTTPEDAQQMHELLGQSELLRMKGVGHMPNLEASEQFNTAVLRLLSSVRQEAGHATSIPS